MTAWTYGMFVWRELSAQNVVPGIGAYAVVRDPQGAVLGLFKG